LPAARPHSGKIARPPRFSRAGSVSAFRKITTGDPETVLRSATDRACHSFPDPADAVKPERLCSKATPAAPRRNQSAPRVLYSPSPNTELPNPNPLKGYPSRKPGAEEVFPFHNRGRQGRLQKTKDVQPFRCMILGAFSHSARNASTAFTFAARAAGIAAATTAASRITNADATNASTPG
jgi:hypothetical protein